jgi:hypothetical protein
VVKKSDPDCLVKAVRRFLLSQEKYGKDRERNDHCVRERIGLFEALIFLIDGNDLAPSIRADSQWISLAQFWAAVGSRGHELVLQARWRKSLEPSPQTRKLLPSIASAAEELLEIAIADHPGDRNLVRAQAQDSLIIYRNINVQSNVPVPLWSVRKTVEEMIAVLGTAPETESVRRQLANCEKKIETRIVWGMHDLPI